MDNYLQAAIRLHQNILNKHWNGKAIIGPDPIGKFHWRITRFIRSYFPRLPGDDRYLYLQGQGYWIHANLNLLSFNWRYALSGNCHSMCRVSDIYPTRKRVARYIHQFGVGRVLYRPWKVFGLVWDLLPLTRKRKNRLI